MTFLNKEKRISIKYLYDFFNESKDFKVVSSGPTLDFEQISKIEDSIFLFNPSAEELRLLRSFNKSVVCAFYYIKYEVLEELVKENVKLILIFSSSDKIMLENNQISKYKMILPASPYRVEFKEFYNIAVCADNLETLTRADIKRLIDLNDVSKSLKVFYGGIKKIGDESSYKNILDLLYNEVRIHDFRPYSLNEDIKKSRVTISFAKNHEFPIIAYYSSIHNRLPLLFSEVYYPWLDWRCQTQNENVLKSIFDEKIVEADIIENNKKLRAQYFQGSVPFKEALKEYMNVVE